MSHRVLVAVCLAALSVTAVSGCAETKRALGYQKRSPDEFAVVSRAPLTIPPEYNLRPPAPGAARPQEGSTRDQARTLITGVKTTDTDRFAGLSEGQQALLTHAGADKAEPDIRTIIDRETAMLAEEDKAFTDELLFWKDAPRPSEYGTVVDPVKEQKRLQETQALGDPATKGATPTIERRQKGLLEGLF